VLGDAGADHEGRGEYGEGHDVEEHVQGRGAPDLGVVADEEVVDEARQRGDGWDLFVCLFVGLLVGWFVCLLVGLFV
jgi:hypothetical protein